jgi:thiol-disulfide isomerase/thioredoxin
VRIFILVTILLACVQTALAQESEIDTKLKGIDVKVKNGDRFSNYDLLSHSGKKIMIIEFWETYCAPCISGMHHLKQLQAKFPDDVKVICVSSLDERKTINFINKNSFPFDFVFDEHKQLAQAFPHSSIPHTIVVDKNGSIQAQTHPGFISEEVISQLMLGGSIDVPSKMAKSDNEVADDGIRPTLVLFELTSSDLADQQSVTTMKTPFKKRIVKGYTANAFIDTVEIVTRYECKAKSILGLYQIAFGGLSEFRFIFKSDLSYLRSYAPNDRYNLTFAASNLFGDFDALLIRHLNSALSLELERVEVDTTGLVLKSVKANGTRIKASDGPTMGSQTFMSSDSLQIKGSMSARGLAALLEGKTHLPVKLELADDLYYEFDIDIKSKTGDIKEWLMLLEKEGLFLSLKKQKFEFIKIRKASEGGFPASETSSRKVRRL